MSEGVKQPPKKTPAGISPLPCPAKSSAVDEILRKRAERIARIKAKREQNRKD
jgi:hypothetical protein